MVVVVVETVEDEAFKKNKIDSLKKRHSPRMGSFVSCSGPNMCRDWNPNLNYLRKLRCQQKKKASH
jgi:hypothetical protein